MTWLNGLWYGSSPPAGHPDWHPYRDSQGKVYWAAAPKNTGGGTSGTSSSGTTGSSGGSSSSGDAKAEKAWKDSLLADYRSYIGDTDAAMPKWMKALKYKDRAKYTRGWLRAKYDEMGYLPKKQREKYRAALSMKVQEWLGAHFKLGDKQLKKILDEWSRTDPDKRGTSDYALFVKQKLSKTKAFQAAFPGYDKFIKSYQANFGSIPMPDEYLKLKQDYIGVWERMLGLGVSVDPAFIETALLNAWSVDKFALYVKSSEAYKGTTGQQAIIARFNNLWDAMFKGTKFEAVKDSMAEKFRLSEMDFDQFFDIQLEQNPGFSNEFKAMFPEFEAYRDAAQRENPGTYISIETFMQRREELKDFFQDTLENYDIEMPPALMARALAEGWSEERLGQHLREAPEWRSYYLQTNEAKVKGVEFNNYWRGIFGVDVPVDTNMLGEFIVNGSGDPSEYFDKIKNTDAFRAQYGFWDEFENAQTAAGHTNELMKNPEIYKQHLTEFRRAFEEIGEPVPEGYDRMFFQSGTDPEDIGTNLQQWYNQEKSYTWASGQKADIATAAGIKDKTEGGNLRNRMQKAIAQHKKFSQSRFNQFSTSTTDQDKLVTKI